MPEWKRRNIRGRTLVYLDAHLDLQVVGEERLGALERCNTAEQVARLEKPHHLAPDDSFSFSIEDFLYPAHRLGLIERVIWVVPGEKTPDASSVIKRALYSLEGVPLEDLKSFLKNNTHLEALLLGVPVTVTCYRDLGSIDIPPDSLIDIDIDYFVSKGDHLWVDPRQVFLALDQLSLRNEFITICRSVTSGFTPLRYRFVADYLAALFEKDDEKIIHYSRLYELDRAAVEGNWQRAVTGCLDEAARYGDCPATYYLAGICEPDGRKASEYLARAARLNGLYQTDVVRLGCEIMNRTRRLDGTTLGSLEELVDNGEIERDKLPLTYLVMGLLAAQAGQMNKALKYYLLHKRLRGRHPRLSFALGSLFLKAGRAGRAVLFFRDALLDEHTQPHAYLRLGAIYLKAGDYELAGDCLRKASELLPSSPEPVRMLAHLYERSGDANGYRRMLGRYRDMMRILAA